MLREKVAVVTGGSKGIGLATALALAGQGSHIVLGGRDENRLRAAMAQIQAQGVRCEAVPGDAAEPATAGALARRALDAFGRIDILVNNAGMNLRKPFLEMTDEDWHLLMRVNLDSAFYASRTMLPHIVAGGGGAVVNVSSSAGRTPHANAAAAYGASKGGMDALTRQLAYDFAPHGVRVNAVCPGPVETEMASQWTEAYRAQIVRRIPLGRLGRPEDVAALVAFLASDAAGFITGETININGGLYMN